MKKYMTLGYDYDFLVYSAPKTGGQSIGAILSSKYKVYHTHSKKFFINTFPGQNNAISLDKFIDSNSKLKIIGSYRKPIECIISAIFQQIGDNYIILPDGLKITENNMKYVTNILNSRLANYNEPKGIFEIVNIDLIKEIKPYYTLTINSKHVLIMKYDDIENYDKIINKVYGIQLECKSKNKSSDKNYYNIYKKFMEMYKIPIALLTNVINNSPILHKIYSTREIEMYFNKWKNRSC